MEVMRAVCRGVIDIADARPGVQRAKEYHPFGERTRVLGIAERHWRGWQLRACEPRPAEQGDQCGARRAENSPATPVGRPIPRVADPVLFGRSLVHSLT